VRTSSTVLESAHSRNNLVLAAEGPLRKGGELPEHVRRVIYGELTLEEKRAALDAFTQNWWKEYAARKNDEEEEHVADTLLYDERCHLPRMAPRPDVVPPGATAQHPYRCPSLHTACERGDVETVASLLRRGIDVDEQVDEQGRSALLISCLTDRPDVVALLLYVGAPSGDL
jgi:hypothetical protein